MTSNILYHQEKNNMKDMLELMGKEDLLFSKSELCVELIIGLRNKEAQHHILSSSFFRYFAAWYGSPMPQCDKKH